MREILFRGKTQQHTRWIYGDLNHYMCDDGVFIAENGHSMHRVLKDTVGQYTGLTDKNGKKIFEGDIVDMTGQWWNAAGPAGHESPITKVDWDDEICGFAPFANYDCDCGVYIEASGCKIIGNIHDNPELLKGE